MAIEDTMAQLAHSRVTQSLPSITNDIQGFQIIDSNDDINSAVGVIAAVINNLIVYIPAIYRKGKIYSMDIMYIPEMKQWLPTQDNWITYLRSRVADLEATLKERDAAGKKGSAGSVNLQRPLLQIVKSASDAPDFDAKRIERLGIPAVLKEASDLMVEQLTTPVTGLDIPGLEDLLNKCASSVVSAKLVNSIANNPTVGNVFAQYYTDEELEAIADKLAVAVARNVKDRETLPEQTKGEVKVITANSSEVKDLSSEDRVRILKDGAVIVDTRGLTPTKVYKTVSRGQWSTPATNGIYELLRRDGSSITAYVVVGDRKLVDRKAKYAVTPKNYVLPLDNSMQHRFVQAPGFILGQEILQSGASFTGGKSINSLAGEDYSVSYYLVVDTDGTALVIRNPRISYVGSGDNMDIYCGDNCSVFRVGREDEGERINTLVKIPAGGRLHVSGASLRVPENCKVFPIDYYDADSNQLKLATTDEYIDAIARREKLLSMKIYNSGTEITISDDNGNQITAISKRAAAYELVKNYAIEPAVATKLADETERGSVTRYLMKLASGTSYMLSVSDADPSEQDVESVDLSSELGDDSVKILQQAGNLGMKEVLDVSVLKILSEDGSSVRMIQDMLPSLFTAMNSVGQLLFMLRAGSSMTEAYGDDRSTEMEQQFTKLMQQLGDAVIVLQQGRINSVEDLLEGPLSQTLG